MCGHDRDALLDSYMAGRRDREREIEEEIRCYIAMYPDKYKTMKALKLDGLDIMDIVRELARHYKRP